MEQLLYTIADCDNRLRYTEDIPQTSIIWNPYKYALGDKYKLINDTYLLNMVHETSL